MNLSKLCNCGGREWIAALGYQIPYCQARLRHVVLGRGGSASAGAFIFHGTHSSKLSVSPTRTIRTCSKEVKVSTSSEQLVVASSAADADAINSLRTDLAELTGAITALESSFISGDRKSVV